MSSRTCGPLGRCASRRFGRRQPQSALQVRSRAVVTEREGGAVPGRSRRLAAAAREARPGARLPQDWGIGRVPTHRDLASGVSRLQRHGSELAQPAVAGLGARRSAIDRGAGDVRIQPHIRLRLLLGPQLLVRPPSGCHPGAGDLGPRPPADAVRRGTGSRGSRQCACGGAHFH